MKKLKLSNPPPEQRRVCQLWGKIVFPVCFASVLLWPLLERIFPVQNCRYFARTGTPCFFCGGTRALQSLLQGEWRQSLELHPMVLPAACIFGFFWIYTLLAAYVRQVPVLTADTGGKSDGPGKKDNKV